MAMTRSALHAPAANRFMQTSIASVTTIIQQDRARVQWGRDSKQTLSLRLDVHVLHVHTCVTGSLLAQCTASAGSPPMTRMYDYSYMCDI